VNSSNIYIEIGQSSLKALAGEEGLELPLERQPNGRLTSACKEKLGPKLMEFLKQKSWAGRARVLCAIGARGVSLRHMTLPTGSKENLQRVLRLKIEAEFPLSPDELAWGYVQIKNGSQPSGGEQEFLVVAVKKDVIEEYTSLLGDQGSTPVFTLAALARSRLCPPPVGTCAMLDIGQQHSELTTFEQGVATSVRLLPWGSENITRSLQEKLGLGREEAEKLKVVLQQPSGSPSDTHQLGTSVLDSTLDALAGTINGHWNRIYLTGRQAREKELATRLTRRLGNGVTCETLEPPGGQGRSAAIAGLKKFEEGDGASPMLVLAIKPTAPAAIAAHQAPLKWAAVAFALVLGCLAFPYVEAWVAKPGLIKRLDALQKDKSRLPMIDRELGFLENLKSNQPPYLDALFILAKAVPQGSKVDSLSMNRRGEISLRGSMRDSSQVTDFRSKLIASGFFSNVTVEEQTPTPDRQKVNLRVSALWRPAVERAQLAFGPTAEEIEKSKNKVRDAPGGAQPGMDFSPGMGLPGMPMGGMEMPPGAMPPGARKRGSGASPPPGVTIMPGMPGMPPGAVPGDATSKAAKKGAPQSLPPGVPIPIPDNP
jgi:type IV pilus assembly protein PilM